MAVCQGVRRLWDKQLANSHLTWQIPVHHTMPQWKVTFQGQTESAATQQWHPDMSKTGNVSSLDVCGCLQCPLTF